MITTDPAIASIVWPAAWFAEAVTVLDRDPRLDAPVAAAEAALRASVESADVTAAVRTMYKKVGLDPTKTRPRQKRCCAVSAKATRCRASTASST